jgi:N-acyl-D-aspartate/D-glutamate deacylase
MSLDFLIKSGEIVDGLRVQRHRANVGIKGDLIAYIGPNEPDVSVIVNASDLVVAPGFIHIQPMKIFACSISQEAWRNFAKA